MDGVWFTNDDGFQLSQNSPAMSSGFPSSILSDAVDLDHDGNLTEPTPFDLAGNARVSGVGLDLGRHYEYLVPNTQPSELNSTAPLTIAENQPVGTIVGEFNATDPDAGATLTYHLVSGAGDGNNTLFDLNASTGALTTKVVFDYENNATSYSIRVQAKDEFNATVEGSFSVSLTDFVDTPEDLNSTAPLVFAENLPVGSTIGQFSSSHDDSGATVTYRLMSSRVTDFGLIPGGWFTMGALVEDNYSNSPSRKIFVSEFFMAKTEVTLQRWEQVARLVAFEWLSRSRRRCGYRKRLPCWRSQLVQYDYLVQCGQ